MGLKAIFNQTLEELEKEMEFSDWEITSQQSTNDLSIGLKYIDKLFLDYK